MLTPTGPRLCCPSTGLVRELDLMIEQKPGKLMPLEWPKGSGLEELAVDNFVHTSLPHARGNWA